LKKLLILLSIVFLTSCSKDPIIYNLTTSANPPDGGTVSPITKQYEEGEIASINATPASEYVLESWTGATGYSSSVNIVMDSDKFVIAKFVKKKYDLTISIEGEGTIEEKVIKTGTNTDYNSGTILELNAIPFSGWRFKEWSGDISGTENPVQITINETKKVTAVFIENYVGKNTSKFLALGDSYTIGASVASSESWPVQFLSELKSYTKYIDTLQVIARSGWRVDQLKEEMNNAKLESPYGLVSLLIGVNNQFQKQDANDFRPEFIEMLEKSLKLVKNRKERLFVISLPDWGASPYGVGFDRAKVSKQIDQFNSVIKEECDKRNILMFDITSISRRALTDRTLIANDGLHPSGKMYKLWVDKMIAVISKIDFE
jgi:lysophospholipase L1-like esterase